MDKDVNLKTFVELWQEELESKDVLTVKQMNEMMIDFNEFDRFRHFFDALKGESVVFLKRDIYVKSKTVLETAKRFLDKVEEYSMDNSVKRGILELVEKWENELRNRSLIQVFKMNEMINDFKTLGDFDFDYVPAKHSIIYLNRNVFVQDMTNADVTRKFLKKLKKTDEYSLKKFENRDSDVIRTIDDINSQIEALEKTDGVELILGRSRKTNKIKLSVLY